MVTLCQLHKSFAVEYDFSEGIDGCSKLCSEESRCGGTTAHFLPVVYSENKYDLSKYMTYIYLSILQKQSEQIDFSSIDGFLVLKNLLYKSLDWEYENEWRIISGCKQQNKIDAKDYYYIDAKPKGIYFGTHMSDTHKEILTKFADEKGVTKYQMSLDEYSDKHELKIEKI